MPTLTMNGNSNNCGANSIAVHFAIAILETENDHQLLELQQNNFYGKVIELFNLKYATDLDILLLKKIIYRHRHNNDIQYLLGDIFRQFSAYVAGLPEHVVEESNIFTGIAHSSNDERYDYWKSKVSNFPDPSTTENDMNSWFHANYYEYLGMVADPSHNIQLTSDMVINACEKLGFTPQIILPNGVIKSNKEGREVVIINNGSHYDIQVTESMYGYLTEKGNKRLLKTPTKEYIRQEVAELDISVAENTDQEVLKSQLHEKDIVNYSEAPGCVLFFSTPGETALVKTWWREKPNLRNKIVERAKRKASK